jgi:hypothetical protein
VKPVYMFRACLEEFSTIELEQAQRLVMAQLKTRRPNDSSMLQSAPDELKSVLYFSKKHYDAQSLETTLSADYQRGRKCTTRICEDARQNS